MRPSQSDDRIEADIDQIVSELLGEDDTATTQMPQRTESTADSGVPTESSSGSWFSGPAGMLFWVFVVVLAGAAVYLLARMIGVGPSKKQAGRAVKRPDARKRKTASSPLAESVEQGSVPETQEAPEQHRPRLPRDVEKWLEKALLANKAGDYREAVRCHYRALIALLDHRKLLTEDETTTVGEYLLEVHHSTPGNIRTFASAAGLFELAWYSESVLEVEESTDMERLFDEMRMATQ